MTRKAATLDPGIVAMRKLEAQQVACPRCRAAAGTPCHAADDAELPYHAERYQRFRTGW